MRSACVTCATNVSVSFELAAVSIRVLSISVSYIGGVTRWLAVRVGACWNGYSQTDYKECN